MIARILIASSIVSLTILVETLFFLDPMIVPRRFGAWLMRLLPSPRLFPSSSRGS